MTLYRFGDLFIYKHISSDESDKEHVVYKECILLKDFCNLEENTNVETIVLNVLNGKIKLGIQEASISCG